MKATSSLSKPGIESSRFSFTSVNALVLISFIKYSLYLGVSQVSKLKITGYTASYGRQDLVWFQSNYGQGDSSCMGSGSSVPLVGNIMHFAECDTPNFH